MMHNLSLSRQNRTTHFRIELFDGPFASIIGHRDQGQRLSTSRTFILSPAEADIYLLVYNRAALSRNLLDLPFSYIHRNLGLQVSKRAGPCRTAATHAGTRSISSATKILSIHNVHFFITPSVSSYPEPHMDMPKNIACSHVRIWIDQHYSIFFLL